MAADDFSDDEPTVLDGEVLVELDADPRTPVTQPYRVLVCTDCGKPVNITRDPLRLPLSSQCARDHVNPDFAREMLCVSRTFDRKGIVYLDRDKPLG